MKTLLNGILLVCMVGCAIAETASADETKPTVLPRRSSVSQYDITWTFDREVPVGQFITGKGVCTSCLAPITCSLVSMPG